MSYRLFGCAVALALAAQSGFAAAADLKVLTTPALTEVWHDLAPKFEAAGRKLTIVYAPSGAIAKRVTDGETADLLVSTPAGIDTLVKAGKVIDGTNTSIASSGMGVAVLKGAPKPDISTRRRSSRAAGRKGGRLHRPGKRRRQRRPHGEGVDRLGIAAEVNARAKLGRGVPAGSFVVKGEADLAIQQMPELLGVAGVEVIGPLPGDLQNVTTFAAGVPTSSTQADAAKVSGALPAIAGVGCRDQEARPRSDCAGRAAEGVLEHHRRATVLRRGARSLGQARYGRWTAAAGKPASFLVRRAFRTPSAFRSMLVVRNEARGLWLARIGVPRPRGWDADPPPRVAGTAVSRARCSSRVSAMPQFGCMPPFAATTLSHSPYAA